MSPLSLSLSALLATVSLSTAGPVTSSQSVLDNGVTGLPEVDCMDDRVRVTFRTQKPFTGRIFVKGMVDKDQCVNSYGTNAESAVQFEMANGQCNMRRSRKLGPDQRGVEQSITIIISFHNTFITKVDRAYRCTCFYMEADKVVTSRFDVSMLPTTDLIDTARMPLCTYSVRRDSVTGPIVAYAVVGEPVFHVWQCSIDSSIVPELTYNQGANLAFSEVNVFKFADKVTTYFQCAVSTCMISEGMCVGKTPPRCGSGARQTATQSSSDVAARVLRSARDVNGTHHSVVAHHHGFETMDLSAEKIVVLDLDEKNPADEAPREQLGEVLDAVSRQRDGVCVSPYVVSLLTGFSAFSLILSVCLVVVLVSRFRHSKL